MRHRTSTIFTALAVCAGAAASCGGKSSAHNSGDGDGASTGDGDGTGASTGDGDGDESGSGGTSTGGGAPTGGQGGSSPILPTLGESCEDPGASACAGNNARLVLLCSAERVWEADVTCGGNEVCDLRESSSTYASCHSVLPACVGVNDDTPFCQDETALVCKFRGVEVDITECGLGCVEGACIPGDTCLDEITIDCSGDCEPYEGQCNDQILGCRFYELLPFQDEVVRVSQEHACDDIAGEGCEERVFTLLTTLPDDWVKVTVGAGWEIVPFASDGASYWGNLCTAQRLSGCAVVPPAAVDARGVALIPQEGAPPRNVNIELFDEEVECP